MKTALLASVVVAASAGSLAITWSDCGTSSTHGKTTDVQPATLPLGAETAITGTGSLDKAVSGGVYDMELKAGGGIIDSHFTGNNCEAKSFDLPLGLGSLAWDGLSCPQASGTVSIGFHAKLASSLPPALATSTIDLKAKDQDSEDLLCVSLKLASQEETFDERAREEPNFDVPGKVFLEGFLSGFIGEATHIKKCIAESAHLAKDAESFLADLKSRKFNQTIHDLELLVQDVTAEVPSCKGAGQDLEPIMAAFKDVHSIKDLMQKLKSNFLAHDREFLEIMEDEVQVCTFGAPDAHKCGLDLGKQARSLMIGDQFSSPHVTAHGKVFMEGFIEGFIGKADHIKACISDSAKTEQALMQFISDVKARKFNQTISDIQTLISDATEDLAACKDAPKDLAPLLAAFKDVHSIKDLLNKMKDNFLAHDKEILNVLDDMIQVCTFGAPDAHKCGADLGHQARSLVIGDQFTVLV